MKRIIVLLLSLIVLFPSLSFADTQQELVGTWIGISQQTTGNMAYMYLCLFDNGVAVYEVNHFSMFDTDGMSFVCSGDWELKSDGVHVSVVDYSMKRKEYVFYLTQAHYLAFEMSGEYMLFQKMVLPRAINDIHIVTSWD
jgi:hypothetical protein